MKTILVDIPTDQWEQFSDLAHVCKSEEDREVLLEDLLLKKLPEILKELLHSGPYTVLGDKECGWNVYHKEGDFYRLFEDETPGHHKTASNAWVKARAKNRRYNLNCIKIEKELREKGALIW